MASRSAKRKRWSDIKDDVMQDMQNAATNLRTFNEELQATNELYKDTIANMEEKLNELLARSMEIDENYGSIIENFKTGKRARIGESSSAPVEIAPSYNEDAQKYLHDSSVSLSGNASDFKKMSLELKTIFEKFGETWKNAVVGIDEMAETLLGKQEELRTILHDYGRAV